MNPTFLSMKFLSFPTFDLDLLWAYAYYARLEGAMTRPKSRRQIGVMPEKTCFQPEGASHDLFDIVQLTLDEHEAIRLADWEGLYHGEAAGQMGVSRQTFGRIIGAAHRKVADVLVNGKILKIGGGSVSLPAEMRFWCPRCRRAVDPDCRGGGDQGCPHCTPHARIRDEAGR